MAAKKDKKDKKGEGNEQPKRTDWASVEKHKSSGFFRRLTPKEREQIKQFILDNPEGKYKSGEEIKKLDGGALITEMLLGSSPDEPIVGEALCGSPIEMEMIMDFTGLRGSGSNIYHSLIYQLPKWSYSVRKVDESIQISPVYADLYNLIIGQKQKLEASIKMGLTSAAQAVADYELLSHDARRYAEMLDYFKEGKTDEHVLRSLFVDRVDAFTGESYSLIGMAKRWPTIITDFIRMGSVEFKGEDWSEVKRIHEKLDVSMAEATVLKTKDRLFKEWGLTFFPAVKSRYARIQALLQARKKSIDEYRNWLKPYIAKYKTMKEADDDNPAQWVSDAYTTPGFGQSEGAINTKLWVWKVFRVWESGKPAHYKEKESKNKGWVLYPYDDFVKRWKARLEYKYNVKIEDSEVDGLLKDASAKKGFSENTMMNKDYMYYIFFDLNLGLNLLRTPPPEGMETDNLMLQPLKTYYISQNVLLLHLLEIKAREAQTAHYIDELIGASSIEDEILGHVEDQFKEKEEKKEKALKRLSNMFGRFKARAKKRDSVAMRFVYLFIRPGPYESIFYERVSKMYSRAIGQYYSQIVGFMKEQMHVGN